MWAELCFLFAAEERLSSLPEITNTQAHFPTKNPFLRSSLQMEGGGRYPDLHLVVTPSRNASSPLSGTPQCPMQLRIMES